MATLVTLGLSKILGKVGEPTALNFTETGYTAFGLTYEDTCKISGLKKMAVGKVSASTASVSS